MLLVEGRTQQSHCSPGSGGGFKFVPVHHQCEGLRGCGVDTCEVSGCLSSIPYPLTAVVVARVLSAGAGVPRSLQRLWLAPSCLHPAPGPAGLAVGGMPRAHRTLTRSGFVQNAAAAKTSSESAARGGAGGASPSASPPSCSSLERSREPAPWKERLGSRRWGSAPLGECLRHSCAQIAPRMLTLLCMMERSAGGWRWDLPQAPCSLQVRVFSRVVKGVNPLKEWGGLN